MLTLFLKLFAFYPAVFPLYFFVSTSSETIPASILPGPTSASFNAINRGNNAAWLQHSWLQEGTTDEQIRQLCSRLIGSRIRFVYPHLTPSDHDGRLPAFSVQAANRFSQLLRSECADVKILPWIGGVKTGYRQMRSGTVQLDSDSYLSNFKADCIYLTRELAFDGVHINIEPVESGNARFLDWLKQIKSAIGPEKILSVAANKPSFVEGFNISPLRSWELKYLEAVARKCDQLVIMNYDTGLAHPFLYSLFVHEKVSLLLKQVAESKLTCRLMLGVPTYDNAPSHRATSENIASAVAGLKPALATNQRTASYFEGIALYGYWTTDDQEWLEFDKHWLRDP